MYLPNEWSESNLKKKKEKKKNVYSTIPGLLKHSRKTLLFDGDEPWVKRGNSPMFDVAMGSYDGAVRAAHTVDQVS